MLHFHTVGAHIQTVNLFSWLSISDVPVEAEDLYKLALVHDPNKEDKVDYNLFLTGKKFINKVCEFSPGENVFILCLTCY